MQKKIDGFILANKNDLVEERQVEKKDIEKLAKKLKLDFIETSAKTGEHIPEVFQKMAGSERKKSLGIW